MTKPYGGRIRNPLIPFQAKEEQIEVVSSATLSGGIVSTKDTTDITPDQISDGSNVRIRYDKISRKHGETSFGAAKPNSHAVLALISVTQYDGTGEIFRFTRDTVHKAPAAWVALTGALTGADTDRIQVIAAFDRIIFTNGVDKVQIINVALTTFAALGNAPIYKYLTAFDNRIVGAYLIAGTGDIPIQVGTSGNGNITEWDPLVDQSAFITSVSDSPADNEDFITGVFGSTNVLILTRQRSIWLGTKTAVPTAPISFYCDVQGIGAGCPYATAVVPGGIVFADHRTRKIYIYSSGQQPKSISENVETSVNGAPNIFNSLQDPTVAVGTYDNRANEYILCIPVPNSSTVRKWIFNFITQGWTYDEINNISDIEEVEGVRTILVIDQLVGTIDSLTGTIDSLTNPVSSNPLLLTGYSDGVISYEDPTVATQVGTAFTSRIITKQFALETRDGNSAMIGSTDQYIVRVKFEFYVRIASTAIFYYSTDAGFTWKAYKTVTLPVTGKLQLVEINKKIRTRKFMIKIESTSGDWDITHYELQGYRGGPSRASSTGTV